VRGKNQKKNKNDRMHAKSQFSKIEKARGEEEKTKKMK
jgi:hypothetical protein